jgi:hypothetical protein
MAILQRRKRLLRLHLKDEDRSIEGIFLGYEAGHYRLANARLIESVAGQVQSYGLDGESWVPRDRVLYGQVLTS